MERDQTVVNPFLSLPTELIVIVISFLSSRDKVKLQYVSHSLRQIVTETPSLWRKFEWNYYDTREELRVESELKRHGEHIIRLAFPGYLTPQLNVFQHCNNLRHLSLPVAMKLSPDQLSQLGEAVIYLKHLHTLDIYWDADNIKPLLLIASNLKELSLYTGLQYKSFSVWANEWILDMGCRPANLNLLSLADLSASQDIAQRLVDGWQHFNSKVEAGCIANLRVYRHFLPLNVHPIVPLFQLQFGQNAVFPIVRGKCCGLQGVDRLLLTDCRRDGKTKYNASITILNCPEFNNVVTSLQILTHFNITMECNYFLSSHLEQVAVSCPNLQQFALHSNLECLKDLKGLRALASHCHNLRELDVLGVSVTELENQLQFWEILSSLKLTRLTAEACVLSPCAEYEEKMIRLYQKCSSLAALCCSIDKACERCKDLVDKDLLALCHFPSLKCLKLNSGEQLIFLKEFIIGCKELQCYRVHGPFHKTPPSLSYASNTNLQQLCIVSRNVEVLDSFMISVSAHGELVHVFLYVASVSTAGITALIGNSPKLLTFYCKLKRVTILYEDRMETLSKVGFVEFERTLRQQYCDRRVFNVGGFVMVQTSEQENRTKIYETFTWGIQMFPFM